GTVGIRSIINAKLGNFSAKAVFTDPFTQANGTPLNAAKWTTQSGSFTVQSNAAASGPGANLATLSALNEADVRVEADVSLVGGAFMGLVTRNTGPDYYTGLL